MKKLYTLAALTVASLQLCAAEAKFGIVNFNNCITDSKIGKQEQIAFEGMSKQFKTLLEDNEKQIKSLQEQLHDKDYMDGVSPEAEQEMNAKLAQLSEEMNRYYQQYSQVMQQGQYRIVQTVVNGINQASDKIAAAKGYTLILNKEFCFYYAPSLDVTADVIKEMDKNFDAESAKVEEKK
jgi:outer membrane protein